MVPKLVDEIAGAYSSFYFHVGNSNVKKSAMYVALGLFAIMAILVMLKRLDLTDPGVLTLWTVLAGSFTFLLGKNQEGEVRYRRRKRGLSDEE